MSDLKKMKDAEYVEWASKDRLIECMECKEVYESQHPVKGCPECKSFHVRYVEDQPKSSGVEL